ncbi:glycosyltransferase family 9 protein [Enterobacteriaceae bacterium BIT-l23]|uniref:glycosyltransferase family 9 protein n=1 Tax=Jejubacter sp. L23 TaxID=3092086 RepID=UPI001584E925|nr:glycosyltransferase family 9 protein [Enterobacteriaceae bacterium BIT-l23]
MTDNLLTSPGSLLSDGQTLVASYDIEHGQRYGCLSRLARPEIHNAALRPFHLDIGKHDQVTVINGMGVALGDSVIGIEILNTLRRRYPELMIRVLRPACASDSVEALYRMAHEAGIISELARLPARLPDRGIVIDMGNQLFRRDFATQEMHDFFYNHMGLTAANIPIEDKQNRWLRKLSLPDFPGDGQRYVLLSPGSSTPLRAIPRRHYPEIVERLHQRFKLPVLGFNRIAHPAYRCIARECDSTPKFIAAIAGADYLYSADSSALHIAAGFQVPTRALFSAIPPALRTRYYPACDAVWLGDDSTRQLHQSNDAILLQQVAARFDRFFQDNEL